MKTFRDTITSVVTGVFKLVDNLWKRDKKLPHMFFCYPKLPKCDNSRGYSGFYHLSLIYGKRDKVSKEKLKSFSNTITNALTENFAFE